MPRLTGENTARAVARPPTVRRYSADRFHESHDRFEIAFGRPNESKQLLQLFGELTVVVHRDGTVAIEFDAPAIECLRVVESSL